MQTVSDPSSTIQERLKWDVTPELYDKIRRLWIAHSKAEDAPRLRRAHRHARSRLRL